MTSLMVVVVGWECGIQGDAAMTSLMVVVVGWECGIQARLIGTDVRVQKLVVAAAFSVAGLARPPATATYHLLEQVC